MRKLVLLLMVPALCAAQSTYRTGYGTPGAFSFGVGADFVLPITEGFKNVYNLGIGGTARVEYAFTPDLSAMLTAGYISIGAKEISGHTAGGLSFTPDAASMVPIVVGLKYYFMPGTLRFYGAFDAGLTIFSVSMPSANVFGVQVGGGSASTTEFTYQPQLGMLGYFSNNAAFDIGVRWIGISDFNSLGIRFGVLFDL